MAKATAAFTEWDSESARSVSFEVGDPVPDHIASKVGAHVVDKRPAPAVVPDGGGDPAAFEAAVEARASEVVDERVETAVAEYREREQAAYDAVTDGDEFDPSADGVKAKDVNEYLSGLDRDTVAGAAEFDRVTQAERDGENRSTAFVAD